MKQFRSSGKRNSKKKRGARDHSHVERAGIPAAPTPIIPPTGATPPGSSEKNIDYHDADRELNLSPLGSAQAGFGEFFDDEWDEDQDIANDFLRARDNGALDNGAFGDRSTGKKDFLEDGDR